MQKDYKIRDKTKEYNPNVMITNYCNQNCSFCFAHDLMKDKTIRKEMTLEDYKSVINKIINTNRDLGTLKLFGGEPTLHSKFDEIIQHALKFFPQVQIYTNGIFSDKVDSCLKSNFPRIGLCFNINTPGFQNNDKLRTFVSEKIMEYAGLTYVVLSITIDPNFDIDGFIKKTNNRIFEKRVTIRIGASNPIAKKDNVYGINQFPAMGSVACQLIRELNAINDNLRYNLDCGFVKCMFNQDQQQFLIDKKVELAKGCLYGNIDILTGMQTIPCYPLSNIYKLSLRQHEINEIRVKFLLKQYLYGKKYIWDSCKKCKFFGLGENHCSGPCLALLINNGLKRDEIAHRRICNSN